MIERTIGKFEGKDVVLILGWSTPSELDLKIAISNLKKQYGNFNLIETTIDHRLDPAEVAIVPIKQFQKMRHGDSLRIAYCQQSFSDAIKHSREQYKNAK